MSKRCATPACSKWAINGLLCKECAMDPQASVAAEAVARRDEYLAAVAVDTLIATKTTVSKYHVQVEEGTCMDVLTSPTKDGMVVCRVTGVSNPSIGYYPSGDLMTEQQIYERFIIDEDKRLLAEIEDEKRAQEQKALDYERALRDRMKAKAEADKRQRAADAENRRIEADRLQRELEAQRAYEAEQQKIREENERQAAAAIAAKKSAEEKARIDEARKQRAEWDAKEAAAKEEAYLASLPAWKRDLVKKKKQNGNTSDTVFPGAGLR